MALNEFALAEDITIETDGQTPASICREIKAKVL